MQHPLHSPEPAEHLLPASHGALPWGMRLLLKQHLPGCQPVSVAVSLQLVPEPLDTRHCPSCRKRTSCLYASASLRTSPSSARPMPRTALSGQITFEPVRGGEHPCSGPCACCQHGANCMLAKAGFKHAAYSRRMH